MADMRAMLDELMGKDRDLPAEVRAEVRAKRHFSDPEHCKHWLCGLCPHTLFTSTKRDLGPCDKEHDKDMLAMYTKDPKNKEKYPYEDDLSRYLRKLVADVGLRVARGKQRLEKPALPLLTPEQMAKVTEIEDQIQELNVKAEMAGESGDVDQAQIFATMTENLGKRLAAIKEPAAGLGGPMDKEQVVCDVCGAIEDVQVEGAAPTRREDHLRGKLHLGHQKILDHLKAYEEWRDQVRKDARRGNDDRGHGGGRDSRDPRRERSRSRERRDRDHRDHRDHHRDRDYYRGGGGGGHRERDRGLSPDRRERERGRGRY